MSRLTLVTAPATQPVSLAEAKLHCRVDTADEDALITGLIDAAVTYLEGRFGVLGRALVTQTWDWHPGRFPAGGDALRIPIEPVQSVTAITIVDTAGDTQTLGTDLYEVDTASHPSEIRPAFGLTWPSDVRDHPDAITVRLVAGYGASSAVPMVIRQSILMLVADMYAMREATPTNPSAVHATVQRLLAPLRHPAF